MVRQSLNAHAAGFARLGGRDASSERRLSPAALALVDEAREVRREIAQLSAGVGATMGAAMPAVAVDATRGEP